MTAELESMMEEQLAELIEMESAFDQKAKTLNDQYEYDEDWEESGPSAVMDTGATSGAAAPKDKTALVATGEKSTKVFLLPTSKKVEATDKMNWS